MEFRYTNRGPLPWGITRTNVIRLKRDGDKVIQSRHYVRKDGSFDENGIKCTYSNHQITTDNIAKGIHWGCCGWTANTSQIWSLKERVEEFIDMKEKEKDRP